MPIGTLLYSALLYSPCSIILPVSPHSRTAARSACSRHALTVTLPTMSFKTFTSPPTSDFTLLFSVIVFSAACAYVALLAYNHRDVLPRGIVIYQSAIRVTQVLRHFSGNRGGRALSRVGPSLSCV